MTDVLDVLVVGAGPTGLTLAGELLRRGLTVRVIDEAEAPTVQSRAIVVHARTLEILDDIGVADALRARGVELHGATIYANGQPVFRTRFEQLDTRFPYLLSVAQSETEAVLAELLERRGGRVERKTSLDGFRQDGTGVNAMTTGPDGEREVRAAWLVGCDGARSTVRKALDIPFDGDTYDARFLLADVKIDWDVRTDMVSSWFADDGMVACFPMRDARWRVIATDTADVASDVEPSLDEVQTLFAKRTASKGVLSDPVWTARFRIHCRQVAHYRDDRVFLAGDAAHIHSPAGGQGMNTGIQDAHNLAWKLALVHRGHARALLLDSYHAERHEIGRAVLRGTDLATKIGTLESPLARTVRDELARFLTSFHAVQKGIARQVAELAVSYEESALVGEDRMSVLKARVGTAAGAESPTVGAHRQFESGPRPGTRALDGRVRVPGEGAPTRLLSCIDTRFHTLLLFDGRSASDEGYTRLAHIASRVAERFGESVRTWVVTPQRERPAALPSDLDVLLDADHEIETRYGATSECLYVVRPDLYVGYRAQPPSEEKLVAWLRSFLR